MTSKQRTALDKLEQRVQAARSSRDPFETLGYVQQLVAEARELERSLESDLAARGKTVGLTVQVSLEPPRLRQAS